MNELRWKKIHNRIKDLFYRNKMIYLGFDQYNFKQANRKWRIHLSVRL